MTLFLEKWEEITIVPGIESMSNPSKYTNKDQLGDSMSLLVLLIGSFIGKVL